MYGSDGLISTLLPQNWSFYHQMLRVEVCGDREDGYYSTPLRPGLLMFE